MNITSFAQYMFWLAVVAMVIGILSVIIRSDKVDTKDFTKSFFYVVIFRLFMFRFVITAINWWFSQVKGARGKLVFARNYALMALGVAYIPIVIHWIMFALALAGVPHVRWFNETLAWYFPWPVLVGSWWLPSWTYLVFAVVWLNYMMSRWNMKNLIIIDNSSILHETLMKIPEFEQADNFKITRQDTVTYIVESNAMIDIETVQRKIGAMQNRIGNSLEIPSVNNIDAGKWEFTLCAMPYKEVSKGKWQSTVTLDMLPPIPHSVNGRANIESLFTYYSAYNTRPVVANRSAWPHELITGASNTGKTNYGACRTVLFNRQNPQMVNVVVGIIKGLADFQPLQWNQDDIEKIPAGADEMEYIRSGKVRRNDNLILVNTPEKYVRLIEALSTEMEERERYLENFLRCKNYFDLLDSAKNPELDKDYSNALDIPRACWINLYVTELTNMVAKYGDGESTREGDKVGKAMGQLFTMVREARDRGIFICAEGQEGTIKFASAFRRNSVISMFGVTPTEAKTQIGLEVHPQRIVGLRTRLADGKNVSSEMDCSAYMDDDNGRRIITDANAQLTDENREFCLRLQGLVESEDDPQSIATKNAKIMKLFEDEDNVPVEPKILQKEFV